ncbi:MAG: hypothetical protein NTX42_04185 [Methanothrix sp.]|nr:hypothetical protein [Methanothrix sp.]
MRSCRQDLRLIAACARSPERPETFAIAPFPSAKNSLEYGNGHLSPGDVRPVNTCEV